MNVTVKDQHDMTSQVIAKPPRFALRRA